MVTYGSASAINIIMINNIDFSHPSGDLNCIKNVSSLDEAKMIAREYCSDKIIVIYGKDCKTVWIKDLMKSGAASLSIQRVVFMSGATI